MSLQEELLKSIQNEIDPEISSIPPLYVDLFYKFLMPETDNLFNREIQDLVYKKLLDMYHSNPDSTIRGIACGLEYWFQGIRSYLELSDIIAEIEPIDQIPEIKTRLYRIPTYAQLLESVLSNLFRFLRDVIGSCKDEDYSMQINLNNLKNILEANGFKDLFHFVDIDVRNAINHGGVIVSPEDVKFIYTSGKNKLKQEKVWTVINIFGEAAYALLGSRKPHFDDFIEGAFDDAGGIIVGTLRFFSKHNEVILKNIESIYSDWYLLTEYMCRFFSYPGFICTHIDTGLTGSSQLNIHFFVEDSNHGRLKKHAFEVAIIASNWNPNYQRYAICYRHLRMPPGMIRFTKEELEETINNLILPENVMRNIIRRGDFMLFEANNEEMDLEVVKRFRYPLIGEKEWMLREINDSSNETNKRFLANLYIPHIINRSDILIAIDSAINALKNVENPPSPVMKIKHGKIPADAVYLHVFKRRSRRKNRFISPDNTNFICLVEWRDKNCPPLKHGGIPKTIWKILKTKKNKDIIISWNPNFQ